MKNIILLTSALAAAVGAAVVIAKKRKRSKAFNAVHEIAKKNYHRTDVFAKAKEAINH